MEKEENKNSTPADQNQDTLKETEKPVENLTKENTKEKSLSEERLCFFNDFDVVVTTNSNFFLLLIKSLTRYFAT